MNSKFKQLFNNNNFLSKFSGIKFILENVIESKPIILFFISPEVLLKSKLIKNFIEEYSSYIPSYQLEDFKLLSLDFNEDEKIKLINKTLSESNLIFIYAYYAKYKTLPERILKLMIKSVKEKYNNKRIDFLINLMLSTYYLFDNNLDSAENHIKYCIEYINYNYDFNDYETMNTYVVCGKYLEKTMDIFVSNAGNYYELAADLAEKLKDNISLATIFSYLSYYYHNIENNDKALLYGHKALEIAKDFNLNDLNFSLYKIIGIIYLTAGDFEKASAYTNKALGCSYRIKDFSSIESVKLQNSLGFIYYLHGKFKESLECHLRALKELSNVPSSSEILDEAVKTFDNLSTSFLMLGDIDNALFFADITTRVISDINYGNKINDIQNLCKQYADVGIIYGLFMNDYKDALLNYNYAKDYISKNDHYIKFGKLTILQSYVKYHNNEKLESKEILNRAFYIFEKHGSGNIYVQSLLVCYYIFFSTIFPDDSNSLLYKAKKIANDFTLNTHYNFYIDFFIEKKHFPSTKFNDREYPLNLILMLSSERRRALSENRKAKDFEIIQDFSSRINLILTENALFDEAQNSFNKNFLSKGFVVIRYNFSQGFDSKVHLHSSLKQDVQFISKSFENFIENKNLLLNLNEDNYYIFNDEDSLKQFTKSAIIFNIYDEINTSNYYFIIFNDKRCDWVFSFEDAEPGMILIKNLFLKLTNIHYTESIKNKTLTDSMTGLYNSKYMWNKLNKLIIEHKSNETHFSMCLIDLNEFKKINDAYGHYVGDEAIKFFSKILKMVLNPNKEIIRYGGDEFIIFFENVSKEDASRHIILLNEICSKQPLRSKDYNIYLSFSYGIESYSREFPASKDFFSKVDKLMYADKLKNKNLKR